MINNSNIPVFTKEQIEWLESVFPELNTVPNSPNDLYLRLGQRQVILYLRNIYNNRLAKVPK